MARDSWSVLPTDLLSLVLNLVSFHDLVRLTAVCKSWRQPVLDGLQRRHPNLPWIISFDNGKFRKLDLCDPWLKKSYSLVKTIRRDGVKKLLLGTSAHASKYGWLLLSKQEVKSHGSSSISYLFYNPFCNKIIKLPPLYLSKDKHASKAMFSTTPTAPDCVIFVLSQVFVTREKKVIYMLSTCKDKKWTSFLTTDGWGGSYVQDAVHMDGKFYCVFNQLYRSYFKLGIFNVALQEWSIEQYYWPEGWFMQNRSMHYLIEFDGELFLVTTPCSFSWKIWQFDRSRKTWTRTKSLGDRVLFLNHMPSSPSSMAAVGEAMEFANMIVHLGRSGYKTFTCKDDQGDWTHHQTRDWYRRPEHSFWIDSPNFQT
ncbi:F-box/kelch-repeat protein At1g57790-like [Rosa rugosa]|uniref:F-box/kelch-repeat protein At1g57790-like n=1 Tax=Rosa rugosa TaxID=74645 RepID=UPI002B401465|nr:F-box/kelch-repeat protein At1g57790-like [Rosa rugosa]